MENKKPTQTDRVIDYMKQFGGITTFEAFKDLGVTRLPARIVEVKGRGYKVRSKSEKHYNRFGEPVYVSRYSLVAEDVN